MTYLLILIQFKEFKTDNDSGSSSKSSDNGGGLRINQLNSKDQPGRGSHTYSPPLNDGPGIKFPQQSPGMVPQKFPGMAPQN